MELCPVLRLQPCAAMCRRRHLDLFTDDQSVAVVAKGGLAGDPADHRPRIGALPWGYGAVR